MKEKKPSIQDTKSLTTKKNEPKSLSVKEKNTSLAEDKNKETALVKKAPKQRSLTTKDTKETSLQTIKKSKKEVSLQETSESSIKTKSIKKSSNSTTKTKVTTKPKVSNRAKDSTKSDTDTKVSTKTKKTTKKQSAQEFAAHANEYFDLPYRYNETVVKLLAQTPKRLFVYWDISDKDRENYITNFGEDFFDNTIPFLRIKNETHNYTFDVDINDFANSWYIDINDDNSKYSIELYRRFKDFPLNNNINNSLLSTSITDNSIFIVSSNKIDAPNGKVISTTYPRTIQYRNIKTNKVSYKELEKPTNEFYKIFFKDENYSTKINATSSR